MDWRYPGLYSLYIVSDDSTSGPRLGDLYVQAIFGKGRDYNQDILNSTSSKDDLMLNFLITQCPEAEEPRELRLRQKSTYRIVYMCRTLI